MVTTIFIMAPQRAQILPAATSTSGMRSSAMTLSPLAIGLC
jgi:hypothetical protein